MHYHAVVTTLIRISSGHGISKKIITVQLQWCTHIRLPIQGTVTSQKVYTVRGSGSYRRYCTLWVEQLGQRSRPCVIKIMCPLEADDHHCLKKAICSNRFTRKEQKKNWIERQRRHRENHVGQQENLRLVWSGCTHLWMQGRVSKAIERERTVKLNRL